MADKTFHLRANEVRAESRALMQKLRAERLAVTRHRPRAMPVAAVEKPAAVTPAPVTAAIIPSRKIQAAVEAPMPVEIEVVEEVVLPVEVPAPNATLVAPEPVAEPVAPPRKKRVAKPRQAQVEQAVIETSAEAPTTTAVSEIADVAAPAAPPETAEKVKAKRKPKVAPVETAAPLEFAVPVEPPVPAEKPRKPRKTARPVTQIIAEGFGSVAELQQAVAEAVAVVREPVLPPRIPSPRAKESIASIPTLGPGMVWRLNQLGFRTLGDLAEADESDLRAKLGPVAKLVRVENWISYARAA